MTRWQQWIIAALGCGAACLGIATSALAAPAGYPKGPVTLVVPTGPGGGTDLAARAFSERLSAILGQPVVVDNRAGAGGIIGTQDVAKSRPDGHTLLISSNQFGILPAVQDNLPFDPVKDFIPVTSIGLIPTLVLVNPSLPVRSVAELIDYARKQPGGVQYASAGIGSPNHLFAAMFGSMADVPMMHVPFRGTSPALVAVAGGQTAVAFASQPA
ncbi:tripartite tricarboxylate transporter substrate-binding protein, partial [Bordetella pertussis]